MILNQLSRRQSPFNGGMTMFKFVWAEDQNHAIGFEGHLPWHLPADMKFFKETTIDHTLVSGSRTFASYGRPLPRRKNIVLTLNPVEQYPEGVIELHSLDELLDYAKNHKDEEIYVSGGASIFKLLLPYASDLYVTKLDGQFPADTYMPEVDYSQFELVSSREGILDEKNTIPHRFEHYRRK